MSQTYQYVANTLEITDDKKECKLPHSCDDWMIGDKEDARALIADLQAFVDGTYVPYKGNYANDPARNCYRSKYKI